MNVLIPMAGSGSRFTEAGYTVPKPLIDVDGKPMIECVVNNLGAQHKYIFVVQKNLFETHNLEELFSSICTEFEIVIIDGITEGTACTALLASDHIDRDGPLMIANSDQYLEGWDKEFSPGDDIDGCIVTFKSTDPNCSYIREVDGVVTECREKEKISNIATVGLYYWSKGSDFIKYANQMIEKNIRTNNEFYTCPVYNEAIADGKRITTYPVKYVWQIGTPDSLELFLANKRQIDNMGWQDYP